MVCYYLMCIFMYCRYSVQYVYVRVQVSLTLSMSQSVTQACMHVQYSEKRNLIFLNNRSWPFMYSCTCIDLLITISDVLSVSFRRLARVVSCEKHEDFFFLLIHSGIIRDTTRGDYEPVVKLKAISGSAFLYFYSDKHYVEEGFRIKYRYVTEGTVSGAVYRCM